MPHKQEGPAAVTLQRRHFITGAVLTAGLLLPNPAAAAEPPAPCEALLAPSPADALADYVSLTSDIQLAILRPYYTILRNVSSTLYQQYAELKRLVAELEALVPALRTNETVSRVRDFTDVGQAGASSIKRMAPNSVRSGGGYIALVSMTSDRLNAIAEALGQDGALTLSEEAARRVREILAKIKQLNRPTVLVDEASAALTRASNVLGREMDAVENSIREAIRLIVEAETLELAAADDPRAAAPRGARELRAKAVASLDDAIRKLEQIPDFAPPASLQPYMADARSQAASPGGDEVALSTQTISTLLKGTKGWIQKGNPRASNEGRPTGAVAFLNASAAVIDGAVAHHAGPARPVAFLNASASAPPPPVLYLTLYKNVRAVLQSVFPAATVMRVLNVVGKLLSMADFSQAERYRLLYKLLPDITPQGTINLSLPANEGLRRAAAEQLSRINV